MRPRIGQCGERPRIGPVSLGWGDFLREIDILRRDNQDEVRQAKLASSSRCKSGPGKG
jgi:hypothetical protein